jgi:hypothetical protein
MNYEDKLLGFAFLNSKWLQFSIFLTVSEFIFLFILYTIMDGSWISMFSCTISFAGFQYLSTSHCAYNRIGVSSNISS